MIEIPTESGPTRFLRVRFFDPLDGWEIQHRFLEFAASKDKAFRRAFTLEVLSYATIVFDDGREMEIKTDAVIDNHLVTWQNVQLAFEEVLRFNGIDPATHANKTRFWSDAGAEMAIAFFAESSKLMGPALDLIARQKNEG